MRRKVSTVLDEALFRRTKLESARRGKQISEIMSEALEQYLSEKNNGSYGTGVVTESWGILRISRRRLKRAMEEDGLFNS